MGMGFGGVEDYYDPDQVKAYPQGGKSIQNIEPHNDGHRECKRRRQTDINIGLHASGLWLGLATLRIDT